MTYPAVETPIEPYITAVAWAAISNDETAVVAYSADLTEAVEKAKASGEERPAMIRVSECAAAMLL